MKDPKERKVMMEHSVSVVPIGCKFGAITAYVYYIDAPEPALVDTGVSSSPEEIEAALAFRGVRMTDLRWILLTHTHLDHHGGAWGVWEKTERRAKVVVSRTDAPVLRDRRRYIDYYYGLQGKYFRPKDHAEHIRGIIRNIGGDVEPALVVSDGDRISLGEGVSVSVLETPGHSDGSVSYVLDGHNWVFTGDAVQLHGATNGIPIIEDTVLHRRSLRRLLESVKPDRLYLGHSYLNAKGEPVLPTLEGEAALKALRDSLEADAWLQDAVKRHLSGGQQSVFDEKYREYLAIAQEIGYTRDPTVYPCAFLVTMDAYKKEQLSV